MVPKIVPDLTSHRNVHQSIRYFFRNEIKKPWNYHAIIVGPSIEEKIVWCHTRNGVIDKIDFVICRQGHHHHSTPSVVSQRVRDENDPRMVPIMKIKWATRILR